MIIVNYVIPLTALNAFQKSTPFNNLEINVISVMSLLNIVSNVKIKPIAFSVKVTISILIIQSISVIHVFRTSIQKGKRIIVSDAFHSNNALNVLSDGI